MTSNKIALPAFLAVLIIASVISVGAVHAGSFRQGDLRFSMVAGSSRTSANNYGIIGLGVGYYLFDGLELGLDAEAWMGGDSSVYKLSPEARYVFPLTSNLRPYLGTFYRHIFIEAYDDLDSGGIRGGVYFASARNWFLGAGLVYEVYFSCRETPDESCERIYPEVNFSLSF